jgi:hypothetical protein
MWATVGVVISAGWGFYFATANKDNPIGPIVSALASLTQPVVAIAVSYVYVNVPVGLTSCVIANAATYAVFGLTVETIRRYRALETSN